MQCPWQSIRCSLRCSVSLTWHMMLPESQLLFCTVFFCSPYDVICQRSPAGIRFDLEAFTFNQVSLNLLDDPTLAAAFSVSLKTSFLQVPHSVQDPVGGCDLPSKRCMLLLHCGC
jgi:hypothetical protein